MSKPTIAEMVEHLEHTLCPKDVFTDCPKCQAIRALILAVGEWGKRVSEMHYYADYRPELNQLLDEIRDFGEEGK